MTLDGSFEPTSWSPDGTRVAGHVNAEPGGIVIYSLDVRSGKTRETLSVAPDFIRDFHVSRDRHWLYLARGGQEADLWLATMK